MADSAGLSGTDVGSTEDPPITSVQDVGSALAKRLTAVGRTARSEEDVRIGIERELLPALEALQIDTQARYEVTLLSGAADAVYGSVVIEYERPGKIATAAGYAETTGQLRQYLYSIARDRDPANPEEALKRMVGVSIDGRSIVFCQYRTATADLGQLPGTQVSLLPNEELVEGFEIRGPYEITPASVSLMLTLLRAMSRPSLSAAALTDEFGPDARVARSLVPIFYQALGDDPPASVEMFFREWSRLFGIVYGEDADRRSATRARELADLYGLQTDEPDLLRLLFSIHTYFALVMKLLAVELVALQRGALIEPFVRRLPALTDHELATQLERLESGDLFSEYGIVNFVEGDFFQWYLHIFRDDLAAAIRELVRRLDHFEPTTSVMEPERAEDLLKELYQALIPRKLRHDLGEYYTPDWLAEYLVDEAGFDGTPPSRFLDPACGSGTFLVIGIQRLRRKCLEAGVPLDETADLVLNSVVGFDINPLAVIASRTNYLLALGDLVRHRHPIEIPVYFADSVLTPAKLAEALGQQEMEPDERLQDAYIYRTVVGNFPIPSEIVDRGLMEGVASLIHRCLHLGYSSEEFSADAQREFKLSDKSETVLEVLFSRIAELEEAGLNGIWARILRNSVAPLAVGEFDFVIGNPPWVQWEDLVPDYRNATADLWRQYGMQPTAGGDRYELGRTKRDFSMLFAYACSDNYLKSGGTLAFLITQTVFQTATGEVFRDFEIPGGSRFEVLKADDLVSIKPFDAQNWSGAVIWRKGDRTTYPVPYRLWNRLQGVRIRRDHPLELILQNTQRHQLEAKPSNRDRSTAPWLIARPGAHDAMAGLLGASVYEGNAGIVTWADGVYWVNVVDERTDGKVIVENLAAAGKRTLPFVREAIEPDLLYPFVPWASIGRWKAEATHSLLVPHSLETGYLAIPEEEMRRDYPATLAYLYRFKEVLEQRSGYRQLRQGHPFYILGNTGSDFRAPYKVVWRSMGSEVKSALLEYRDWYGHEAPEVHKNTASFVPFRERDEACYLCGMLNASPVTTLALATSVRGGKTFAGTGLLGSIRIPTYDRDLQAHRLVAEIADAAIAAPETEDPEALDHAAARVWDIDDEAIARIVETRTALMG